MEEQTKGSKKIIEKLLNWKAITEKDFKFLKANPEKFKNIKFIKKDASTVVNC
ncbi:MAG: hypothetical protein Q4A58_03975 [Fusobacterium sp.]|uniref:hypothetical protein n=1 Tax=Fusobacterium sp. TaxID=68766 RepID=UPI0026DC810B|nr:hypothetical protein [Fusobacterium sp.]MDO4690436.1 hypothetical protein [Fusobacterium sp.]